MPDASVDISALPKLDERDVRFEWDKDWWDGPHSGVATYEGSLCWFECESLDKDGRGRLYVLFKLAQEEQRMLSEWHATDVKWHATFVDRHDGNEETPEAKGFLSEWRKHSAAFRYPKVGPAIGWFISGKNPDFYAIHLS